jgi:tetratricopeptide (TPR) repeat protein
LEAHQHGKEIVYRAGRLGIVREKAGIAALRAGEFQIAQKDLRAASRITGSKEILPYIAQCEVALGNPRKALEIAGKIKESELSREGRVEMRIAAAGARSALGEHDAAVLTLTCAELNEKDAAWSLRLHRAYRDALLAAGRKNEVQAFERTHPQLVQ